MRVVCAVLGLGAVAGASACCGVGAHGEAVRFTGQTNLIVWDKDRGVEHFVRDARFATKGADLGFIAPTPGRPTLAEADARVFAHLDALQPREETPAAAMTTAVPASVQVIEAMDIAGYHATVLKASDGGELTNWLKANGYAAPDYLAGWVAPYVQKGWYLTAFKVTGEETGPVRMSFDTKVPFNPYSVPAENGGSGAPLRLYYVSAGREVPRIGGKAAWRKPEWSVELKRDTLEEIANDLYLTPDRLPVRARLTVYQDDQFGTPGLDDLYFVPDDTPLKVGLGVGAVVVAAGIGMALRRRNAVASHAS